MKELQTTTRDVARELARKYSMMSHDELDILESVLVPKKYAKGEMILAEGDVCKSIIYIEKGLVREFEFYDRVERIAKKLITENKGILKPVCANVDFYSGLVYSMLGIPEELFTPLFAIARMSGWSAHRLEEIVNAGKIIRPAYRYVGHHREYTPIDERKTKDIINH